MGKKRNYGGSEDSPDACFGALGRLWPCADDNCTGLFDMDMNVP